jgi:hypothetical protein
MPRQKTALFTLFKPTVGKYFYFLPLASAKFAPLQTNTEKLDITGSTGNI